MLLKSDHYRPSGWRYQPVLESGAVIASLFVITYLYLAVGLSGFFFFVGYLGLFLGVVSSLVFFGYGLGNRILEPISAIGFFIGFVAFGLGFVSRLSNGPRDPWLVLLVAGAVLTILSFMYAGRFDLVKLLSINLCLVVIGGVLLSPWMYDWVFFLLLSGALWLSVTNRPLPYETILSLALTCLGVAVLVRAFLGSGGKLVPHSAWEPVAITFVLQSPYASVFGVEGPAIFLSGPGSFAPIHPTEIGIGAAMYVLCRRSMSLRLKA